MGQKKRACVGEPEMKKNTKLVLINIAAIILLAVALQAIAWASEQDVVQPTDLIFEKQR